MTYHQVILSSGSIYVHLYYNTLTGHYPPLLYNYDLYLVRLDLYYTCTEALDDAYDYTNCFESTDISFCYRASRSNLYLHLYYPLEIIFSPCIRVILQGIYSHISPSPIFASTSIYSSLVLIFSSTHRRRS